MSKRIVLFNHKGGVSKTTSVYNIGWMLSKTHRVLVVDADPQCNLSNLILGDDFEKYYIDPETRQHNIKDGVSVAFDGKPSPIQAVNCFSPSRATSLYLLAGHANLSEYDTALSFASINAMPTLQNLPGAFAQLMKLTEEKYNIEYTLIDLNPGLSAINQNLFLSSHGFVVPTNPDPFSVMAIDTLKDRLPRWVDWKRNSIQNFSDSAYPLLEGVPKFLGTLIQRFNIRNGVAARPYRDNISEIKKKVSEEFFVAISEAGMALNNEQYPPNLVSNGYCLDEIPDFQGLLPKSRVAGVPIFELTDAEINETGKILTTMSETRNGFSERFNHLGEELINLLHYA
ncbi:ParA family protein [Pseudanabaena sp. FACHB-1277]|uniref:ParA family protein n=1 Tax=Pseudanabaena cinerea FACHB-1277 TaxID=2949581 RepID=A0A926Z707_9CYAN|nr:ParA family protein [Pseudanabaena cinerea]MBD2151323.1 ParA family protein [Pseudanabaena cinerea FACHB-1277]